MMFVVFFLGYMVQVAPCAFLCIFPLTEIVEDKIAFRKKTLRDIPALLLGTDFLFSCGSMLLINRFGGEYTAYILINALFLGMVFICIAVSAFILPVAVSQKLFLFLFTFNYGILVTVVCMALPVALYTPPAYEGLPYKPTGVALLAVVNLICLPLFSIVLRRLCRLFPIKRAEKNLFPKAFYFLPIPFTVLTFLYAILIDFDYNFTYSRLLFLLFLIGLLLTQLAFYWFMASSVSYSSQLSSQEQKYQLTLESYRSMERHLESLRVFRHEFNRYLTTINSYLLVGQSEEAQAYIRSLLETPALSEPLSYCRHPMINALLHSFLPELKAAGVNVKYDIQIPPQLSLPDEHLIGILYNLLQNASEACRLVLQKKERTDPPFLHLGIHIRQDHLVILCTNSYCQPLRQNSAGRLLSSKKDPSHHGYGMQIMKQITEQHDGIFEYKPYPHEFQVSIALHLNEMETEENSQEV